MGTEFFDAPILNFISRVQGSLERKVKISLILKKYSTFWYYFELVLKFFSVLFLIPNF